MEEEDEDHEMQKPQIHLCPIIKGIHIIIKFVGTINRKILIINKYIAIVNI
jgi:hypothetical protein